MMGIQTQWRRLGRGLGPGLRSLAVGILVVGCGQHSNVLGLVTPTSQKDTFVHVLASAQAAYDRGQIAHAYDLAKKAQALDPDSEAAAVLFGFVSLSMVGTDPFQLAKAMSASNSTATSSSPGGIVQIDTVSLQEWLAPPPPGSFGPGGGTDTTAAAGVTRTTDAFGPLKAAIGFSTSEIEKMGALDGSDPDLPILIPTCAETVRAEISRLTILGAAISAVCPFVDESAHVRSDQRQDCQLHSGIRRQGALAAFLWAFAHLTEALAFNSVLTYGENQAAGKKSNLEMRVEKIKAASSATSDPATIANLVKSVQTLNTTLQAVLPVTGKCSSTAPTSQLRATLNDMLAVDAAFDAIPGTPPKVKAALKNAISRVKNPASAISTALPSGGGADPSALEAQVLKGDLTKNMSSTLASKLDAIAADPNAAVTASQKASLCANYAAIAAGSGQVSSLCPGS